MSSNSSSYSVGAAMSHRAEVSEAFALIGVSSSGAWLVTVHLPTRYARSSSGVNSRRRVSKNHHAAHSLMQSWNDSRR